ncbi:unnamed protein product [Symbiodinium microadriaticum]|nr:unnamed protein product [Symbiodinium microadriaticum]
MFDMLREIALSQGVLAPAAEANAPEDDTVDTHAKMQYQFLGFNVCKLGLAELLGVGWNPRLTTLLKAVLQNRRSAPLDKRFMSRPLNDPRPVYSEVVSHLQTLYDSVAETLPFDQPEQEHVDDDFTAYNVAPTNSEQLRYLPPGSMYESWRQYRAVSNSTCSWQCFSKAWKDIDQWLGELAGFVRRKLPVCQTPDQLITELNTKFLPFTRPKEPAADYLRSWVDGTLAKQPPLDGLEFRRFAGRSPVARANVGMSAMSMEPAPSVLRVHNAAAGSGESECNAKMSVLNDVARDLHQNGMTWLEAYAQAYKMWGYLPPSVRSSMESSLAVPAGELVDDAGDAGMPLEAEFQRES